MDLKSLTPQLAGVLRDMGVSYDPKRLADALRGKQLDVTARGAQVAATLGGFVSRIAQARARSAPGSL